MNHKTNQLLKKTAILGLFSSLLFGTLWPGSFVPFTHTRQLPSLVHLLTIGVYIPLFLIRLNTQPLGWAKLSPSLPWLIGLGLIGMISGFLTPNLWALYLGGHYAVPGAIYLISIQSALGAWKNRKAGGLHGLGWPVFGLFIIGNLGGMLVLDRFYGGRYGFFMPNTVLMHAIGALLLFILPVLFLKVKNQKHISRYFALGALGFVLFLYGALQNNPSVTAATGIITAILFVLLSNGFHGQAGKDRVYKMGWLIAAIVTVLATFNQGVSLAEPKTLLAIGLFLLFGLVTPYTLNANNLLDEQKSQDFFQIVAILLGACLSLSSYIGSPLWPLFGLYFSLSVIWILPFSLFLTRKKRP